MKSFICFWLALTSLLSGCALSGGTYMEVTSPSPRLTQALSPSATGKCPEGTNWGSTTYRAEKKKDDEHAQLASIPSYTVSVTKECQR